MPEVPKLEPEPGEITILLNRFQNGDAPARDAAFSAVYNRLRRMAASYMRRETPGQTLEPMALVHEAYLKLLRYSGRIRNRGHFFALASEAMRRILVDRARARHAAKRGGDKPIPQFDEDLPYLNRDPAKILSLNVAVEKLQSIDPRKGQIVVMRFFGGLSEAEIASALDINIRTVRREWALAKAWLYAHLA